MKNHWIEESVRRKYLNVTTEELEEFLKTWCFTDWFGTYADEIRRIKYELDRRRS